MDTIAQHIGILDDLGFHVFSDQAWEELSKAMSRTSWSIGLTVTRRLGFSGKSTIWNRSSVMRPTGAQHPVKFGLGEVDLRHRHDGRLVYKGNAERKTARSNRKVLAQPRAR